MSGFRQANILREGRRKELRENRMKNVYVYEGVCRHIQEKISKLGNKYWIASLDDENGRSVDFVFFKIQPQLTGVYRVKGYLNSNSKGFPSLSVDTIETLEAPSVKRNLPLPDVDDDDIF